MHHIYYTPDDELFNNKLTRNARSRRVVVFGTSMNAGQMRNRRFCSLPCVYILLNVLSALYPFIYISYICYLYIHIYIHILYIITYQYVSSKVEHRSQKFVHAAAAHASTFQSYKYNIFSQKSYVCAPSTHTHTQETNN